MSLPSLPLSALQHAWLRELQIAPSFLKSYTSVAVQVSASPEVPVAEVEVSSSDPAPIRTATMPVAARAELHSQLGLKKPEAPIVATVAAERVDLPALSQQNLVQLGQYAQQCTACPLHEQRQQAVVGAGVEHQPDWMVISIAPSSNEEIAGLPMQGKSGELFANQLQSIALPAATTFYTTQLLKCRSPHHAKAEYIQACQGILQRQIELIRPRHLLLLGQATAQLFFGHEQNFEQLRGQLQPWTGPWGETIPAVVTYDPVSLLLRPQDKVKAWADLLFMQGLTQA